MIGCLCVYGFTGGAYEVNPLVDYLTEHTNWLIKVAELPGHGKKLFLHNASYREWISAAESSLIDLIDQCDKIYLIGFSMGGMITAYLASKYKVSKLVLLSASGKYLSAGQLLKDFGQMLVASRQGNLKDDPLYNRYKNKRGVVPMRATREFIRCIKFTRPFLSKISCPVLIAQGKQDSMVPYRTAFYLKKNISSEDKEVVFFDRSKHLICLGEDKDELCLVVFSFLDSNKGG